MRYSTDKSTREFTSLPGCNQVAVVHGAFMRLEFRGQGLASEEHRLALAEARRLGYDALICTCRADNPQQMKVLADNNWRLSGSFQSSYTGGIIYIYVRGL